MASRNIFDAMTAATSNREDSDMSDSDSDFVCPSSPEIDESDELLSDSEEPQDVLQAKDGTQWSNIPPNSSRARARNIIHGPINRIVNANHVTEKTQMFKLLISDSMVAKIVKHTNSYGQQEMLKQGGQWKATDETEMWAFIGILITSQQT